MINKFLTTFTALILLGLNAVSQQDLTQFNCSKNQWQLASWGFQLSDGSDSFEKVNADWMKVRVGQENQQLIPDFEEEDLRFQYNSFRTFIGFEKVNRNRNFSVISGLRFGMEFSGSQYLNYSETLNIIEDSETSKIIETERFNLRQNQVAVIAGYQKGIRFRRFTAFTGIELSLGTSLSPELQVQKSIETFELDSESNLMMMSDFEVLSDENYTTPNHLSSRASIPLGVDFQLFKFLSIGGQYNWGVGLDKSASSNSSNVKKHRSMNLGIALLF